MPLRLNGSTSGYVQLSAPAVAGTSSLILPTGTTDLSASVSAGAAWTAYTPVLTASTTNPTMGTTGALSTGYYMQIGKLVVARFYITFGTGMTAGTGAYYISLPVNASTAGGSGLNTTGSLFIYDSSTGNAYTGLMGNVGGDATKLMDIYYAQGGALTAMGAAAPWAWAVSDQIRGTIMYEAA